MRYVIRIGQMKHLGEFKVNGQTLRLPAQQSDFQWMHRVYSYLLQSTFCIDNGRLSQSGNCITRIKFTGTPRRLSTKWIGIWKPGDVLDASHQLNLLYSQPPFGLPRSAREKHAWRDTVTQIQLSVPKRPHDRECLKALDWMLL